MRRLCIPPYVLLSLLLVPPGYSLTTGSRVSSTSSTSSSNSSTRYTIGPSYSLDPAYAGYPNLPPPRGHIYTFDMPMRGSKYYDCTAATNSAPDAGKPCLPNRTIAVYIPPGNFYSTDASQKEVGVVVSQDGPFFGELLAPAMDALVPRKAVPMFISVAVSTGTKFDGPGTLRDIQYDTMSGKYARFIDAEVLPAVVKHPAIARDFPGLKISADPAQRMTLGCSSGGAAAFSMAWFEPDLFGRVVAYSPTLVLKDPGLPSKAAFPLGAWEYHSPPGAGLIDTTIPNKPIYRIFHSVNERDLGTTGDAPYAACLIHPYPDGPQTVVSNFTQGCFSMQGVCPNTAAAGRLGFINTMDPRYSNWIVANERTAMALASVGYTSRFLYAKGACHCEKDVFLQDLPSTLVWAWK